MTDAIALAGVALAWLACTFCILQLVEQRARGALAAAAVALAAGGVVLLTRDHGVGIDWLCSEALHSDAIALGALVPTLTACIAPVASARSRASTWAPTTGMVAALACATAGIAALAIGRSSWYWEFVAMIGAGVLLAVVGVRAALAPGRSPNVRLAFATGAAAGAFLAVGGTLLLLAWRSLETL